MGVFRGSSVEVFFFGVVGDGRFKGFRGWGSGSIQWLIWFLNFYKYDEKEYIS